MWDSKEGRRRSLGGAARSLAQGLLTSGLAGIRKTRHELGAVLDLRGGLLDR